MTARTKVLYISSWGRSGSTILDTVLGQASNVVSVGEIVRLWDYGVLSGGTCSCRKPFTECEVWSQILANLAHELTHPLATRLVAQRDQLVRSHKLWSIPKLQAEFLATPTFADHLADLYATIARETGATLIVDSSKHPAYGVLLSALPSIDLRVVHLVRNPKAVAYSWKRKKITIDTGKPFKMRSALETGTYWNMWNWGIAHWGKSIGAKPLLVRYEDFVRNPRQTLQAIAQFAAAPSLENVVDANGRIALQARHVVIGNPIKAGGEVITLREDREWENNLKVRDRVVVETMTRLFGRGYGY